MSTLALDGVLPRSRRTDPTTSVDAGRDADLRDSQREVLWLFESHAGRDFADHELVDLAQQTGSTYSAQRIRSARAELTELGRIVQVEGEYRKTKTKRARVWALPEGEN